MQEQEVITADLEPLLGKDGIEVLELGMSRRRGEVQVHVVIHSAKGTGTTECAKTHRLIGQRLLELFGIEEAFIEVSSPGIDRLFRSRREYSIFAGSRIRFLREGESEWTRGRLLGIEGEDVSIETGGGRIAIPLSAISKARLDSTPEGD